MAVATKARSPFADLLREALEESGVTVTELSRLLAQRSGRPEDRRRSLQRYLRGEQSPTQPVRDEIADSLGVSRSLFTEDREREEQHKRLMNALLPLADVLLEIATETGQRDEKRAAA